MPWRCERVSHLKEGAVVTAECLNPRQGRSLIAPSLSGLLASGQTPVLDGFTVALQSAVLCSSPVGCQPVVASPSTQDTREGCVLFSLAPLAWATPRARYKSQYLCTWRAWFTPRNFGAHIAHLPMDTPCGTTMNSSAGSQLARGVRDDAPTKPAHARRSILEGRARRELMPVPPSPRQCSSGRPARGFQ